MPKCSLDKETSDLGCITEETSVECNDNTVGSVHKAAPESWVQKEPRPAAYTDLQLHSGITEAVSKQLHSKSCSYRAATTKHHDLNRAVSAELHPQLSSALAV